MAIKNHDPLDIDIFSKPIAGQSLTDTPGSRPYEKPPQITSPKQAFDMVSESLEEPSATKTLLNLLDAGISAETLASAVTLKMFSEGMFSPDVAEIIKPPLTAFISDLGMEADIDGLQVVNEIPDEGMTNTESIELMSKINPQKFQNIMEPAEQEEAFDSMVLDLDIPEQEGGLPPRQSFLEMEGQ
tara:strand:+ start:6409 stop:6966 length:558 start_codon:yes stop_codon:yes gene_type:complete